MMGVQVKRQRVSKRLIVANGFSNSRSWISRGRSGQRRRAAPPTICTNRVFSLMAYPQRLFSRGMQEGEVIAADSPTVAIRICAPLSRPFREWIGPVLALDG